MAVAVEQLSLASAVLSGGARLAAAGGGLPQRITTAADFAFAGGMLSYNNPVFADDGLSFWWTSFSGPAGLYCTRIADGALLASVGTAGSPMGLSVDRTAQRLYVAVYTTSHCREYDMAGNLTADLNLTGVGWTNCAHVVRVPGTAGKIWARGYAAANTVVEFSLTTGIATGRTIVSSVGIRSIYATTGYIWVVGGNGRVVKYDEPTLAVVYLWDPTGTSSDHGGDAGRYPADQGGLTVDSAGRPIVVRLNGAVDRYSAIGGAGYTAERLIWGANPRLRDGVGGRSLIAFLQNQPIAFSVDEAQIAFPTVDNAGAISEIRVRSTAAAVSTWSKVFATSAVISLIGIPGALRGDRGNDKASVAVDFRAALFAYRVAAGAWVAFSPGAPLAIPIAAGQTLDVRATMNTFGQPPGNDPWIGGDAGEGITLVYEDTTATGTHAATMGAFTGSASGALAIVGASDRSLGEFVSCAHGTYSPRASSTLAIRGRLGGTGSLRGRFAGTPALKGRLRP